MPLLVLLAAAAGVGAWWGTHGGGPHAKRAVIVDQLSATAPDPAFVSTTKDDLQRAGYAVDYFSGDQINVEFYRQLPARGYDLIVLRAHSGLTTITNKDTGAVTKTNSVSLFSNEPFDTALYQPERDAGRLGHSRYLQDGAEVRGVFGIEPDFVRYSMKGGFGGALVVLMGCNGLNAPTMAQAFLARGAKAVVGWDDFVSAEFTDKVTSDFLNSLLVGHVPINDAVSQTSAKFGRDPNFHGGLQLVTETG